MKDLSSFDARSWRTWSVGYGFFALFLLGALLAFAFGPGYGRNFFLRNFVMFSVEQSAHSAGAEIARRFPPGAEVAELERFLAASGARCGLQSHYGGDRKVCRFAHDNPLIPLSLVEWIVTVPVEDGRTVGGYGVQVNFRGF